MVAITESVLTFEPGKLLFYFFLPKCDSLLQLGDVLHIIIMSEGGGGAVKNSEGGGE